MLFRRLACLRNTPQRTDTFVYSFSSSAGDLKDINWQIAAVTTATRLRCSNRRNATFIGTVSQKQHGKREQVEAEPGFPVGYQYIVTVLVWFHVARHQKSCNRFVVSKVRVVSILFGGVVVYRPVCCFRGKLFSTSLATQTTAVKQGVPLSSLRSLNRLASITRMEVPS